VDIEVYTFEKKNGEQATDWTTQNPAEAREYGEQNGYMVIANKYEFSDSELVWDFTGLEEEEE
jgi:hypothetical protein